MRSSSPPTPDELRRLGDVLLRVEARVGDALAPAVLGGIRAIVGDAALIDREPLARSARDKIRTRHADELTTAEYQSLVDLLLAWRPVVATREGAAEPLPAHLAPGFPRWEGFRARVKPVLASIGRVQVWDHAASVWIGLGTGFVVAPGRLLTNRHVVEHAAGRPAFVAFGAEVDHNGPALPLLPDPALPTSDDVDLALYRFDGDSPPALDFDEDGVPDGEDLAVVGHPAYDERSPVAQRLIFGTLPPSTGPKRIAPGEARGEHQGHLVHDASTLGGNSGSPVLRQSTGGVIGVHRSGTQLLANFAVRAPVARGFAESAR